ncbi:replication initiator protein A [Enterococcus sp. DIV0098]|uniref:replication initiator protein A n=1 Tax=Enterococcus sp. DIV0098 TaxID=2774843 RepID=UPI003A161A53
MEFEYYHNNDGDQFRYIQLPTILLEHEYFSGLSLESIVLYSMMLNRINLSFKNGWIDEHSRVYIYFTMEEVMKKLRCKSQKATKIIAELDVDKGIGLIERKRQGLGKPTIIYVKNFMSIFKNQAHIKTEVQTSENQNYGTLKNRSPDCGKSKSNYIDISEPDLSKNDMRSDASLFGLFENVILTQEDYEELSRTIVEDLDGLVDRLSAYMTSTGKTYKNHKATLLSWYLQDEKKYKKKSTVLGYEDYDKGEHL